METFSKIVQIESLISRENSLIPSFYFDDEIVHSSGSNWGCYTYDIDLTKCKQENLFNSSLDTFSKIFDGERVSFLQLVSLYKTLKNVLDNAVYYKRISKKNADKWVTFEPLFFTKYNLPIYDSIDKANTSNATQCGVYVDNTFTENGGNHMFNFLLKAMGIFVVPNTYIKDYNGVPETMYFSDIEEYMERMLKFKNTENCCEMKEYDFLGGDAFYLFLGTQVGEAKKLRGLWEKVLYKDENNEIVAPNISIDFSLNADFHTVGMFTVLDGNDNDVANKSNAIPKKFKDVSRLIDLRDRRKTYCEILKDGKVIGEELMPFIMEYKEENIPELINPYRENSIQNINKIADDYYGDIILKIGMNENDYDIEYVLGAKLNKIDDKFEVEDKEQYSKLSSGKMSSVPFSGVFYKEKRKKLVYSLNNKQIMVIVNDMEVDALMSCWNNPMDYIDMSENVEAECIGYFDEQCDTDCKIIMDEYNFGKVENLIENVESISIDRGYVSAYELHYKLGEINTLEDMENYQNNYFEL